MKKFKKYISLVLIMYILISPVYTNALSIEEIKEEKIKIKEEISKKENMKIGKELQQCFKKIQSKRNNTC